MRRASVLLLVGLLPGLMAPTAHNPGGLSSCSHVLYSTTTTDGSNGSLLLINTGPTELVLPLIHTDVTEVYDALGDWEYATGVDEASWAYTGVPDIRVFFRAVFQMIESGGASDLLQVSMNIGFKSEGDVSTADATATGGRYAAAAGTGTVEITVADEIAVDTGDSIGVIADILTAVGYIDHTVTSAVIEIQQVSPPCVN